MAPGRDGLLARLHTAPRLTLDLRILRACLSTGRARLDQVLLTLLLEDSPAADGLDPDTCSSTILGKAVGARSAGTISLEGLTCASGLVSQLERQPCFDQIEELPPLSRLDCSPLSEVYASASCPF